MNGHQQDVFGDGTSNHMITDPLCARSIPSYSVPNDPYDSDYPKSPPSIEIRNINPLYSHSDQVQITANQLDQSANRSVKWTIAWQPPTLMVICAVGGFASAIGHHLYYRSLNGRPVDSPKQQQWPIRFGTAFSFLTVALLKLACHRVYDQYIWTLFKRKAFPLQSMDRLFTLTSDMTYLPSLDLLRNAKLACLLALACLLVMNPAL
jgi:hypothetical protein